MPNEVFERWVREFNRTWLKERLTDLRSYLHPGVVMVIPGFAGEVTGIDACVDTFREFLNQAKILQFAESDIHAHAWGTTAVLHFRFDVTYELDGITYQESGREVFTLVDREKRWCLAWRTQIPIAASQVKPSAG